MVLFCVCVFFSSLAGSAELWLDGQDILDIYPDLLDPTGAGDLVWLSVRCGGRASPNDKTCNSNISLSERGLHGRMCFVVPNFD